MPIGNTLPRKLSFVSIFSHRDRFHLLGKPSVVFACLHRRGRAVDLGDRVVFEDTPFERHQSSCDDVKNRRDHLDVVVRPQADAPDRPRQSAGEPVSDLDRR